MQMQHPAFPDVTFETDDVDAAVEAGWLKPTTKAAKQLKAEREDAAE